MEHHRISMHPLTQIRQNLRTIRERYGVARIGIFGSVVRDEATAASDVDILVEFQDGEETHRITSWILSSTLRISWDEGRISSSSIR